MVKVVVTPCVAAYGRAGSVRRAGRGAPARLKKTERPAATTLYHRARSGFGTTTP
jgi:hypothetical protein